LIGGTSRVVPAIILHFLAESVSVDIILRNVGSSSAKASQDVKFIEKYFNEAFSRSGGIRGIGPRPHF